MYLLAIINIFNISFLKELLLKEKIISKFASKKKRQWISYNENGERF